MVAHGLRHRPHAGDKDSGTDHVLVILWLTLYKLTGRLADDHWTYASPIQDASSTTKMTTPYALLFCCRGKFSINHKRFSDTHILGCLVAGISSHSGDHHAHSTRSGKQSEIVRSTRGYHAVKCMFRVVRAVKCMCRVR